jgi:copper chaperone CopZ
MKTISFFHLDCNPIIAECGFHCDKCVNEIRSVLKKKNGILEVTLTEQKNISVIAIEYDAEIVKISDLLNELEKLPSFYSDKFIPKVVEV